MKLIVYLKTTIFVCFIIAYQNHNVQYLLFYDKLYLLL